jgi:hypothetical protein
MSFEKLSIMLLDRSMFDIDLFLSRCCWINELENGTELMIAWATQGRSQITQTQNELDIDQIANSIDCLQTRIQSITNEGVEKLDRRVEERLKPLCEALTSKVSTTRGKTGENLYENWVSPSIGGSWNTECTKSIPHSGDYIHTHYDSKKRVIVDVKNYSKNVPSSEKEKLWHDMETQQISLGILVSLNSRIVGHREIMDIEFRTLNGTNSCMIMLSNAMEHKELIAVGLEMLRLYTTDSKCSTFETLREVLESIKALEDSANKMEKDINSTLLEYRKQIQTHFTIMKRIVKSVM